ncbi:MAG: hypothetical protein KTR31_01370 [Myxococcales bacterium]|nr:hypothetical protein [Myxococcales bacterium]
MSAHPDPQLDSSGPPSVVEQMKRLPDNKSKTRWRTLVIGVLLSAVTGLVIFTSFSFETTWETVVNRRPDGKIRRVTATLELPAQGMATLVCDEGQWTGHVQLPTPATDVRWTRAGAAVAIATTPSGSRLILNDPRSAAATLTGSEPLDLRYADSAGVEKHVAFTSKGLDQAVASLTRACP